MTVPQAAARPMKLGERLVAEGALTVRRRSGAFLGGTLVALGYHGLERDLRVPSMPSVFGEKVIMRVVAKTSRGLAFEQPGFLPERQELFQWLVSRPCGMIPVTGAADSGKSATLDASLAAVRYADHVHHRHRGSGGVPALRCKADRDQPQVWHGSCTRSLYDGTAGSGSDHGG